MLFCANQKFQFHWVVCPCLADGNKVRQVFTNLLSSSPFSPLQDYLVCSSPMNVSHMSPMLQKSPLCLIWPPKGGEGKARDTVFISTVAGTPD